MSKIFEKTDVLIKYAGELNEKIESELLSKAESEITKCRSEKTSTKKTIFLLIELIQNARHYATENPEISFYPGVPYFGLIIISYTTGFKIKISNIIEIEDLRRLTDRIKQLNSLSYAYLKEMYKSRLMNSNPPKNNKAGLGLLYVAMKSDSEIKIHTQDVDNKYSKILLEITIEKNKRGLR